MNDSPISKMCGRESILESSSTIDGRDEIEVSILINNFNYGRFVGGAIGSALGQTYSLIEVIVVDDGSTDNSREVIGEYGNRIKAIYKANGGQASAFNAAFANCTGEIVIFLDSDDELHPDAVAEIVKFWQTKTFSKIQFPLEVIDERGDRTGAVFPKERLAQGDVLPELLSRGSYTTAPTSGNAFSRKFLSCVMPVPDEIWVSHADCYLIHIAPFFGPVGLIDRTLGKYRVHSTTLSLSSRLIDGKISLARIRFHLVRDVRQHELIDLFAKKNGRTFAKDNILNGYAHYKLRFVAFKLNPVGHPFQDDTLNRLIRALIVRVWNSKSLGVPTKIAFTIWAFTVALLPISLVGTLITQAVSPENRTANFSRLASLQKV